MTIESEMKMDAYGINSYKFKEEKKSGGCFVHVKPLFIQNSKNVLVASGELIKVFDVKSGQLQHELQGHNHKVVGIGPHDKRTDAFYSIDEQGNLLTWKLGLSYILERNKLYLPGQRKVTQFFSTHGGTSLHVVCRLEKEKYGRLYAFAAPWDAKRRVQLCNDVLVGPNKITVERSGGFLAAICQNMVFITNSIASVAKGTMMRHRTGDRQMVCIASHPHQQVLATGDITGRILVWYNLFAKSPTKKILHWHTMPVGDLAFSYTGCELYSGGMESVVVKWQLTEERRYFLPRLGMPICLLATDISNTSIIAAQIDNSLTIIGAKEWKREGIIQEFALNALNDNPFPSGMIIHPTSNAIIMNANFGHLQFYDIHRNEQILQLDITMRNYITQERKKNIANIDVVHTAISTHGKWLVTFEAPCPSVRSSHDYKLKFWQFKSEDQRWFLNTSVCMPHNVHIGGIDIQPTSEPEENPLCVTYAIDGMFKLWQIVDDSDIYRDNTCWNCVGSGEYHGLPLQTAAFTTDGSMLGVAFDASLTMWTPSNCEIRGCLSQPYLNEPIKQIIFGNGDGNFHLVVTRSEKWLCCWDLLTCSLNWRVYVSVSCMVSEPSTGVIAGFTPSKDVFFFEPRQCKPISWQNNTTSSNVCAAVFAPGGDHSYKSSPWGSKSVLCYLDEDMRINVLDTNDESRESIDEAEKMEDDVHQITEESTNDEAKSVFSSLIPKSKNIQKINSNMDDKVADLLSDRSSNKFMTKVLNDLSVHHIDSFEAVAMEFCNLVIPKADEIEKKEEITSQNEVHEQKATKEMRRHRRKIMEKLENTNFDSIVDYLSQ